MKSSLLYNTAPDVAPIVEPIRVNGTHIHVSWILLDPVVARGEVLNYSILYKPVQEGDANGTIITVPGNHSSVLIGGLNPQQTYSVEVWATTAAGDGVHSSKQIVEAPPSKHSTAPEGTSTPGTEIDEVGENI